MRRFRAIWKILRNKHFLVLIWHANHNEIDIVRAYSKRLELEHRLNNIDNSEQQKIVDAFLKSMNDFKKEFEFK